MSQKDIGNKIPIYKLKAGKEVEDYYDEWTVENKYDKDMVDWKYSGPCLLYTSPSPRDGLLSRMPTSA